MASMKLQGPDVIKPLPKIKTVKSFFAPGKSITANYNEKSLKSDKNIPHLHAIQASKSSTASAHASIVHADKSVDDKRKAPIGNSSPMQKASKKIKPSTSPGRGIDYFFKPKKT
jgi:hypothetical protein